MRGPGCFISRMETLYPLYSRLRGFQDRSGRVRKFSFSLGFDLRTVQPIESRYMTTLSEDDTKRRLTLETPVYYSYMYHQVQYSEFLPASGGYLHILYGSQNTQPLFPGITWTVWILLCGQNVYLRYEGNLYIRIGFRLIFVFCRVVPHLRRWLQACHLRGTD